MKKLSIILALFVVIVSCKGNEAKAADGKTIQSEKQDPKLKRYEVKSGIIHYKSSVSGKVMGSVITGSGTEDVYFKDWGAIELIETKATQTTNTNIFGQKSTETTNTHTIAKLNNGESYHVDFDKKQIFLRRDMAMDMTKVFQPNADAGKVGKDMLEGMGGKKIGNEKFLGYDCEVWDIMGGKQWMYKGVVLKLEMTVMGIKTVKEATSAKFGVTVADKYFKLPDFPIVKEEGFLNNDEMDEEMKEMNKQMEKMEKMSFEEWKKLALSDKEDQEIQNMSEEELRQTYDMMQQMIKMRKGK
jgi:hypothetical protein